MASFWVIPLVVGNLAAYGRQYLSSKQAVEYSIYKEPRELIEAMNGAAPDVIGFSSYSWNHNLSIAFAEHARRINPNVLTLMGVPNFR